MQKRMHKYYLNKSSLCDKPRTQNSIMSVNAPAELVTITHDKLYVVTVESFQCSHFTSLELTWLSVWMCIYVTSHFLHSKKGNGSKHVCLWCVGAQTSNRFTPRCHLPQNQSHGVNVSLFEGLSVLQIESSLQHLRSHVTCCTNLQYTDSRKD